MFSAAVRRPIPAESARCTDGIEFTLMLMLVIIVAG